MTDQLDRASKAWINVSSEAWAALIDSMAQAAADAAGGLTDAHRDLVAGGIADALGDAAMEVFLNGIGHADLVKAKREPKLNPTEVPEEALQVIAWQIANLVAIGEADWDFDEDENKAVNVLLRRDGFDPEKVGNMPVILAAVQTNIEELEREAEAKEMEEQAEADAAREEKFGAERKKEVYRVLRLSSGAMGDMLEIITSAASETLPETTESEAILEALNHDISEAVETAILAALLR